MSVVLVGNPPFPAKEVGSCMVAKLEHIWHSARRWAKLNGCKYVPSYGVEGIAPT
jgi:hypothetical protein